MYLYPIFSTFNSQIYLQTLLSLLAVQTIPNSVHFEQDQISLHPQELLPEHVGDLDNQENFDP